jgi:uracil-DNA glycosylase family 4
VSIERSAHQPAAMERHSTEPSHVIRSCPETTPKLCLSELGTRDKVEKGQSLSRAMRACCKCLEAGYAITPGAVFSGPAPTPLMLVGQAPGVTEVQAKRPFNASSGRRLFQWLGEAGFEETDFRARYYMTAVTKCYPGKHPKGKGDRKPSRAEQKLCRPFLDQELALVQPRVLLAVGGLAIETLLGEKHRLDEAVGRVFEMNGRYILPLPHPSGASLWPNLPQNQARLRQALALLQAELLPLV